MLQTIIDNRFAVAAVILFVTGFVNMMVHPNLIKKVVSFNIMDSATFLMLASRGMIAGRTAAILTDGGADVTRYVNPIPAGLVLTGIVVSVSVSAFSLALIQRIYGTYGTVDMRELLEAMKKRGE
ncbi:MAG: NADH-quinone oxidoreductase subunit K [Oscillospiraceae bacterium]|jgi:multicomponent Na+:H+ antiporter subunit C|nr:NADH-quinone oxidoreductase subunit K [Oscillospiraceae bacterium]MCR5843894.1 sodium:proton antiporter [Oscillospiraceae bacterium]